MNALPAGADILLNNRSRDCAVRNALQKTDLLGGG